MQNETLIQKLSEDINKLRSPDGYLNAGYPNYNTLFGRDSLITSWQLLKYDPKIAKDTLLILAKYQATEDDAEKECEPGKILHEYRLSEELRAQLPGWGWPYYGSCDATSLFLIVLEKYVQSTNDKELLKKLWPNAKAALNWHFENSKKSEYGFITYKLRNPHGLTHQCWKDSMREDHLKISPPVAIVEEQGYAYSAYRAFSRMSLLMAENDQELSKKADKAAENLKNIFRKKFWMPEEKYFAIGLNGKNEQRKSIASNPGHLLACEDFVEKEDAEAIKNRLFKDDLWVIGGIRTLSANDPDYDIFSYHLGSIWPHDNWIIYTGLKAWGYNKDAKRIEDALFGAYAELGYIPELYAIYKINEKNTVVPIKYLEQLVKNNHSAGQHLPITHANPLQAWATGALVNMLFANRESQSASRQLHIKK